MSEQATVSQIDLFRGHDNLGWLNLPPAKQAVVSEALNIITEHADFSKRISLRDPIDAASYLKLRLSTLPYEAFSCLFLDNRHRALACEELFRGTIDGASVHPREVVRACLKHNAAAVIFSHNHPSGVAEPSAADRAITETLRMALNLIDVRVLDHIVVGTGKPVSMAARGLL